MSPSFANFRSSARRRSTSSGRSSTLILTDRTQRRPRAASLLGDALEVLDRTSGASRLGLARVEAARARPRAPTRPLRRPRGGPRPRTSGRRRGQRGTRPGACRRAPIPDTGSSRGARARSRSSFAVLAQQRVAARLERDEDVARAELGDLVQRRARHPPRRRTRARRAASASCWFGATSYGSASTPSRSGSPSVSSTASSWRRLASRIELAVEAGVDRRGAASPRRRRTRRRWAR